MQRILTLMSLLTISAHASNQHQNASDQPFSALVDMKIARELGLSIDEQSPRVGVVRTTLTQALADQVSARQHQNGKCGGFQIVSGQDSGLSQLESRVSLDQTYETLARPLRLTTLPPNPTVVEALNKVNTSEMREFVAWFSSFQNRYNKGDMPNTAVMALKEKIQTLMQNSSLQWTLEEIAHRSTPQKSLRLRLTGKTRPDEIIVLGGHADSIANWGFGRTSPGADDNASGSGAIFEALRVVSSLGQQPARTIEFFWYAGEESGLLGSSEIAASYKSAGKDVVAVLQLDMTAYPGLGSNRIGNVTDYTSSWLRDYFAQINSTYLGLELVPDECGYACSDHASWYQKGYPTLLPFESNTETMNNRIHTANDVISVLDFQHAGHFAKIALIFALDLGNSTQREPMFFPMTN